MSKRLKIAQLTPYYAPVIGGVEVVCQCISEELARRGHEVHVFTANRWHKGTVHQEMPPFEIIGNVRVHRFKSYFNLGHYGFWPGLVDPLVKGEFDIIHSHCYRQPQSEMASRVGLQSGVPTILHIHGGFYTTSRLKRMAYNVYDWAARRRRANRFGHFIALSESDVEQLVQLNVDRRHISIIRNAAEPQSFESVDPTEFRKRHGLEGKKVILYLGILHHFKRPDLMVQALPAIIEAVPDAFLVFVGPDAGELQKVRALAGKLKVERNYKWLGPLRGREKHEAYESCEFLALPSDEDPYPLVLLEALAHGKPLLTTDVVGQAAVIRGSNAGILVSTGDVSAIVSSAIRLLSDQDFRSRIADNARRLAQGTFSVRAVTDEIESLYGKMMAPRALEA